MFTTLQMLKTTPKTKKGFKLLLYILVATVIVCTVIIVVIIVIKLQTNEALKNMKNKESFHLKKHPDWYDNQFPESQFQPPLEIKEAYQQTVDLGYEKMKHSKIVIAGLARDIKQDLQRNMQRMLDNVVGHFEDWRIVIFENDSKDGTREYIQSLNKTVSNKIIVIDCPEILNCEFAIIQKQMEFSSPGVAAAHHGIFSGKRFKKMSYFRNQMLDYIRTNLYHFDFVLFIDWDLRGNISMDGFATNFGYLEQGYHWDAMTAMGLCGKILDKKGTKLSYYDTLAYVPFGKKPIKQGYWNSLIRTTKIHNMNIPQRGTPPIQVMSAFGGAGLYQMDVILNKNIYYSGEYCEHIMFHKRMIEHGYDKIFINPSFILLHTMALANNFKSPFEKIIFATI